VRRARSIALLTAAITAAVALGAAGAGAVLTSRTGTFTERQIFLAESTAWQSPAPAYTNVPGAAASVTVPAGTSRIVNVRFTAESACGGTSGWCTVRAVLVYPTGAVLELFPVVGTDFAFDTADTADPAGWEDTWESHAIDRSSPYLAAGTYRVYVQARTVGGAAYIRLDDWHLTVGLVRP
jgi:hypothetical protein